ncbi:hypothetical protein F8M41_015462 [Gigaspora margarita]|uniref:Uncharacterized protein n=1 Tax=Gigaspora margarita TaxID=4874 RepID=A0A8H3ZWB7_GIGMA|nr:hypothetical protein F8M41_015462 [Gigaspora margarita]
MIISIHQNQKICQNLVRFVSDKAELPQLPNWTREWPIVQSKTDFLLTLCKIDYESSYLDQFAKNIQPTNGLDSESMEILYSEICDHDTCITSNSNELDMYLARHLNSPIQIVLQYMDVHSSSALDDSNIRFIGIEAIKTPLPAECCQELL